MMIFAHALPAFSGNRVMRCVYLCCIGTIAICSLNCTKSSATPAPKVVIGRNWPQKDQVSIDEVRHGPWTSLLQEYVDRDGNVDYARWKDSATDLRRLDEYLDALSRASPDLPTTRDAKLAFWINAYNAVTIKGILRQYPVVSIQDLASESNGY